MKKHQVDSYAGAGFGREFAWLDLANTLEWDGYGRCTDHLADPTWLSKIVLHWDLASHTPRPVPYKRVLSLRKLLRQMAAKLVAGQSVVAQDLAKLNGYLNVPVRVELFHRQNGVHSELVPLHPGWPWILSRITASFADMLVLGRLDRLKYCPNEGCRWVFYDQTKGNTRKWCNDRTCGNRDRVRRARIRASKENRVNRRILN
jgi:predicted RNA-binding Zn ribbon-like protein